MVKRSIFKCVLCFWKYEYLHNWPCFSTAIFQLAFGDIPEDSRRSCSVEPLARIQANLWLFNTAIFVKKTSSRFFKEVCMTCKRVYIPRVSTSQTFWSEVQAKGRMQQQFFQKLGWGLQNGISLDYIWRLPLCTLLKEIDFSSVGAPMCHFLECCEHSEAMNVAALPYSWCAVQKEAVTNYLRLCAILPSDRD